MSTVLGREIIKRWDAHAFDSSLSRGSHRLVTNTTRVSGLNHAARAFAIANILCSSERRIAVICPNSDSATRMHQDIKSFLGLLNRPDLVQTFDFLPRWEHSPYQSFNPSIKNRIRRMRTLQRIRSSDLCGFVCDIESLAQCCPSERSIDDRAFILRTGQSISREELAAKLYHAGYTRNDPVEDPGGFAVRGFLVDIFSSGYKKPLRLDFFDDQLESIRTYDPGTQRSDSVPLSEVKIVPVTEWAITPESLVIAKREIKLFCDEYGIPKQARDEFFDRLDAGIVDPQLEYLSPYFNGQNTSWVADYLDENWRIAVSDRLGVEGAFDELIDERKAEFERALGQGKIIAPWTQLYRSTEDVTHFLSKCVALQMDDMMLGVPEAVSDAARDFDADEPSTPNDDSPHLQIKLVSNSDLASIENLQKKAKLWSGKGFLRIFVASTPSQAERISYLFTQKEIACRVVESIDWNTTEVTQITTGQISSGFRIPKFKIALVTDSEIFGPKKLRSTKTLKSSESSVSMGTFVPSLEDLHPEELIVHLHHGIGRYKGLTKLEIDGVPQDFILIEYASADKLYLPVYRLDQVQRYAGPQEGTVLDKLGSQLFEKAKSKVKADLQELANNLLQLYAHRASRVGFSFSPPDESYREFEAKFPYAETPDQLKAIDDVGSDMQSGKIMDRLICGDVGYGKTEVAMRAAFRAVMDGKQVAVLVPTTILAFQHERSFRERFKDAPLVNIGSLSRFKSAKEIKETVQGLTQGNIDIVIGTHRVLSKDVKFKDLGLIIVDEEQRFGVEHKERLKALKFNTDVLTLTATPIPRTLHLSLMGLRDISVINTPPVDRLAVRTYVARFDEEIIRNAIGQEIARGGQVFFIHNRVQSIAAMASRIERIVPDAKIIIAHGQLEESLLEQRMLDFYNKKGNVLLCSTIIESGLDIPSANTMIINRADTFGLAQLYQLRGRVGRSQARAYCYLMLPEEGSVTDDAKKRLEVIQRFVELGSGFKIASHDLELRGGGDILGKYQSGHIASVGYELYTDLLEETIRELRGQPVEDHFDPEIKIPVPALLPESYVPDVQQRLGLYKRLSQAGTLESLHELELELQDRFGKPTAEVQNLTWLIRIKQLLRKHHVKMLIAGRERTAIDASEAKISPARALELVQKNSSSYSITPDSKIIIKRPFVSAQQLFHELEKFLSQVADG